jgi:hypothetical protein
MLGNRFDLPIFHGNISQNKIAALVYKTACQQSTHAFPHSLSVRSSALYPIRSEKSIPGDL